MKSKIKRNLLIISGILAFGILILTLTNSAIAVGEASFCCERTVEGAWCQNSPPAECNEGGYRTSPTSCEATAYCRLGTCIDSSEGTCLENTPQKVCENNNGFWVNEEQEDIPQCQLGCCLIGDQAAFVTQSRCEKLSSIYDLDTNFRLDIQDEVECIASATPYVKGACVFDSGFERSCRLLTKEECFEFKTTETNVEFHEGFLCSAESLATVCGPAPDRTTCVENEDEVYFLDTCGNLANIYDSSKADDKEYWTKIKEKGESCGPDKSNAGSTTCGNCDYLLGSTCKAYERGNSQTVRPKSGDFVCADLSCRYEGEKYEHGETWCADSPGTDENLPGSEYYKLTCYNAEVGTEPCAAFRQEVCVEDDIDGFSFAQCGANMWQDCVVQNNSEDCENTDRRDCKWVEGNTLTAGGAIHTDDKGRPFVVNEEGELVQRGEISTAEIIRRISILRRTRGGIFPSGAINRSEILGAGEVIRGAACVPLYAPGFDFWEEGSDAEDVCSIASENCIVKFEKKLLGGWKCKQNCNCLEDDWGEERNSLCIALGDCGSSKNYMGVEGYHDGSVVEIKPLED